MLPENTTQPESPAKDKTPRMRSPNYPGIGLKEAVEKAQAVYKQDKLVPSPKDAALKHMGFEKAHGEAGRVLSALKSFGLIEDSNDRFRLTQRGIDIVVREPDDAMRAKALREAAISPEIYRQLLKEYKDSLPSDTTLRSELIAVRKFNPNAVDGFIRDFKGTLEFAGLSDWSAVDLDLEGEKESDMDTTEATISQSSQGPVRLPVGAVGVSGKAAPPLLTRQSQPGEISTPVGRDADGHPVFARVNFDAQITKEYVTSLKKYLDYLEGTL